MNNIRRQGGSGVGSKGNGKKMVDLTIS